MARAGTAIVLIGFMGAGKSTVGPLLAARLGWRFIDLDREIERRAGTSIPGIFRAHGEPAFRRLEAEATAALAPLHATVLATGGGWPLDPAAVARLGAPVTRIWLRVSVAEALRRVAAAAEPRPLLAGPDARARAEALLRQREAAYAQAELIVDVDRLAAGEIVERILSLIRGG